MDDFNCKCCGHCCEGRGGIVVSPKDLDRLADYLGVSHQYFEESYAEQRNGKLHVKVNESGRCCFFLDGKGCAVHPAKPNICRAWPYFRGNLIDSESLALAKDFCPGIPKKITLDDFFKQGVTYLQKEGLVEIEADTSAHALNVSDLLQR